MDITSKEIKFLTILNETRLSGGRLSKRYFEEIKELFTFSIEELEKVTIKLLKRGMITKIATGGDEYVYFHTDKVIKGELDKDLIKIKH